MWKCDDGRPAERPVHRLPVASACFQAITFPSTVHLVTSPEPSWHEILSAQKILPRSKYLSAIGKLVESALSKVLEDVLALPDIPELDSRRLSELCRILNAFEGLFTTDPDEVGFQSFWRPNVNLSVHNSPRSWLITCHHGSSTLISLNFLWVTYTLTQDFDTTNMLCYTGSFTCGYFISIRPRSSRWLRSRGAC